MSCEYIGQRPSADGWCMAVEAGQGNCVPFLLAAYGMVEKELREYRNTGLTPGQIREIDRPYAEQAKELMEYRNTGLTPERTKGLCDILK